MRLKMEPMGAAQHGSLNPASTAKPGALVGPVVQAALTEKEFRTHASAPPPPPPPEPPSARPTGSGTVVLDVEQGGIEVPSFLGKSVRSAVELAEENRLELSPVGSGVAREQSPAAGSHVAAGSRIVVKFER